MADEIRSSYLEDHQRVMESALALPVSDAVFAIVHYNHHYRQMGPPPHCQALPLDVLSSLAPLPELEQWASKADALRRDAYDFGDALLGKRGTDEGLLTRLEAAHPGFGRESYEAALSFGCFQAR